MRCPDRLNPNFGWDWPDDYPVSNPPSLTVYPPDDHDELGSELLGPDGEVAVCRRKHPIGFARSEETE